MTICFLLLLYFVLYKLKLVLQTTESVYISNVTLVDNGMAIFSMIYTPAAISHQISSKTVQIKVRNDYSHVKKKEKL